MLSGCNSSGFYYGSSYDGGSYSGGSYSGGYARGHHHGHSVHYSDDGTALAIVALYYGIPLIARGIAELFH